MRARVLVNLYPIASAVDRRAAAGLVAACKRELVDMRSRTGYEAAHAKAACAESRAWFWGPGSVVVAFAGLAVVSGLSVSGWFGWVLVGVHALVALVALIALLGFVVTKKRAVDAAILTKLPDRHATVLCADGAVLGVTIGDAVYDALRPGDVGVARLDAELGQLDAFHRL